MGPPRSSERVGLREVYTRTREPCQTACLAGQGPGKAKAGKLETRKSGEELEGWRHSCGHCVLWTLPAEEALNGQGDRRTPVDHSRPLSSARPGLAQWAQEWSGCGSRHGDQQGVPVTKADLATATAGRLACQQQRPTLSPRHGPMPQGAQAATG